MSGFVKLYDTILDSSIWGEPLATRIVWITLLAMADKEGIVRASSDGIARRANVPVDDADTALAALAAPDPRSKSQDDDGRRIERLDGGYLILNYKRYRELRTDDQIAAAVRQRRKRERDSSRDVRDTSQASVTCHVTSTEAEAEAEAKAEAERDNSPQRAREGVREKTTASTKWPAVVEDFLRTLQNPAHWEAEFSMWLDGGRELPVIIDDIAAAVGDYSANGERPNMMAFRAYLRRAFKARKAVEIGAVGDALKPDTNGGGVFEKLLDLGELHPNGQFWRKDRIASELGEPAYEAFRAIGGNDRLRTLTTKDRPWVRKEFVEALSRAAS